MIGVGFIGSQKISQFFLNVIFFEKKQKPEKSSNNLKKPTGYCFSFKILILNKKLTEN
jgi:hypothetical protein